MKKKKRKTVKGVAVKKGSNVTVKKYGNVTSIQVVSGKETKGA